MSIKVQQTFDGKSAEHIVIAELLKKEYVPFIPIIERGVDLVVKSKIKTQYIEIQVKSNYSPIPKNQKWFVFSGELQVRDNLIYALVDSIDNEIWLVPSEEVKKYGNQCKTQFDLHLMQRKRGDTMLRIEYFEEYRNNWSI